MIDLYLIIKSTHLVSSAVLFGTGLGIAFFFLMSNQDRNRTARLFAARTTVVADFAFTLPAVIIQPATGAWLIWVGEYDWLDLWLVITYGLYALAGACWIPVVFIQIRLLRLLRDHAATGNLDEAAYARLFRWWFALGWPAFIGLVVVFALMVFKPTW